MRKNYLAMGAVVLGIVFLAAAVYFTFFYDFSSGGETRTEIESQTSAEAGGKTVNYRLSDVSSVFSSEAAGIDELKRIASSFAERFGSYSNHSDFQNIRDLKIFMTGKMKNWADGFIAEQEKSGSPETYYGVSAKAIGNEVKGYDNDKGEAEILVKTQKRESSGDSADTKVFYQDVSIVFKKEGGSWKVDSASWGGKKNDF